MAKSAKKPNSFIKGMQSDLDANVMSTDAYKELINGRIFTREDNSFVIKNTQGNTLFTELASSNKRFTFSENTLETSPTVIEYLGASPAPSPSLFRGVRLTISGSDFTTQVVEFKTGDIGVLNGVEYSYNNGHFFRDYLTQCCVKAMQIPEIAQRVFFQIAWNNNVYFSGDEGAILMQHDLTATEINVVFEAYVLDTHPVNVYEWLTLSIYDGYAEIGLLDTTYDIVAAAKFSNYVVVIATPNNSYNDDVIYKLTPNVDGTISETQKILEIDLDLVAGTSLRVEVSEENEHFHRIYWTDGVNPLRTLNLKEDPGYYTSLDAEDLNVFKSSRLEAPIVNSVIPGGIVLCGSHSYCYRLITQDGKTSRTSQITNPVHVARTTLNTDYHEIAGGALSQNSANSVNLTINNIDISYTSIQIIDIRYTSQEGGIEANIITESAITGSSFSYTHNGNEAVVSISVGDLLKSQVSWDTCKDLAVKNNRLFAANLTNNAQSIDVDFRVKSYRFGSDGTSDEETYENNYINPDLYKDDFYQADNYAWLETNGHLNKIPGAETPNFNSISNGVRVTFNVKQLDLSEVDYFRNGRCARTGSNSEKAHSALNDVPLYGYLDKTVNGGYNNYKNPIFAKDYVGYQRGEIYRFGILFYDKSGNPTFVSPIGDVRMPDNEMKFVSCDASGNRITTNSDSVSTFQYCGAVPEYSMGWTFASGGTVLTKSNEGANHVVGELVTSWDGTSIPKGTYITTTTTHTITISQATTAGSPGAGMGIYFDKPLSPVSGYAIYPQFQVKLSKEVRDKISGYSIVRVKRGNNDKRILASGVINQQQIHANTSTEGTMRHLNGPSCITPYTPFQSHESFHVTNFTFDTPESYFGKFVYDKREGDTIKVVARLDGTYSHYNGDVVEFSSIDAESHGIQNIKQYAHYNGVTTNQPYFLSGRFDGKSGADDNESYQFSTYPIYSQYFQSTYCVRDVAIADKSFLIYHAETVADGGTVSDLRISRRDRHYSGAILQDFKNMMRIAYNSGDDQLRYASDTVTDEKWDVGDGSDNQNSLVGAPTMFLSLEGTEHQTSADLVPDDFHCGIGTELQNPFILNYDGNSPNLKFYAQKLYVQFVRNVSGSQYGGNSESAFENNQYISTGHINFNPQDTNFDSVFGGDTFINMYAKKKIGRENIGSGRHPSMGIIFPVESSVNLDLRDGVFLGSTDLINYHVYDDNLINETYGSQNTSKTYVQKPANFKDVNTYSNLVAASNLKMAGNLFDAYTSWDASEIHELETGKGAIYNLFNLRGDLFAIQQSGVSKLTINPRVVVDNSDAAAVTIATGTGRVIERSDYIDTTYGSQHYNNAIVTNTSAYWYDNNMSAFCKLVYGQGVSVQDLGLTTQNTNILHSLKDIVINDKPLDYEVGGVCLYHNKILDEVGLCITQPRGEGILHLVYSELNDIMVSKREDAVSLAFNLPGELLTIGRNSSQSFISAKKIYRENSSNNFTVFYGSPNVNSMSMTFVCNENVYTSKKFDKLVLYLSENENLKKFTNFTFTDSVSNTPFTSTGTGEKMAYGKHIIPITSTDGTAKATGQHLTIKIESTDDSKIELFGALIHNRATT